MRLVFIDDFETEAQARQIADDLGLGYIWISHTNKWHLVGDSLGYATYFTKKDRGFYKKDSSHPAIEILEGNTLEQELNETPVITMYPPTVSI